MIAERRHHGDPVVRADLSWPTVGPRPTSGEVHAPGEWVHIGKPAGIATEDLQLGRMQPIDGFECIQQYSRGDNQWPGDIAAWRDAGGSHISVVTMGTNLTTVDGHIEAIRRWRGVYNSVV